MSQPSKGKKPAASPRPKRSATARAGEAHVYEKSSGTPSKTGEKKRSETTEEKTASHSSSHPSRISASKTASSKASSFPASTTALSMNPTETKAKKTETEEKSQSTKRNSTSEQPLAAETKDSFAEKETLKPSDQPIPGKPTEGPQNKEKKPQPLSAPVKAESNKTSEKSSLDDALDDLIDTLGGIEEYRPKSPKYTGPPVSESLSSTYIEELGKRESTIPPEYRKLLESHEGAAAVAPDSEKPMGEDEAIDSLSSDFTCSSEAPGKAADKEKASGGEVLKAQSVDLVKSAIPPNEKKRKIEEPVSNKALDDLCDMLGNPEAEPETNTSSLKEVDEAKSREERLKKCGEHEDTLPADYKLKPAMDKDGKPLLPKPEEKPKPISESKLVDELSKDFESSEPQEKQPKTADKAKKSETPAYTPVKEAVSKSSMCVVQGAPQKPAPKPGEVPDDAVEALAGSLAKKEIDPKETKPAVDKIKEKSKEEKREKVGEKEETIPPEYRLKEAKEEDRKLLEKKQSEKISPMSDDDILDALSEGFSCSKAPVTNAAISLAQQKDKGLNDAYDQLSESLGTRIPDPDDNKPMEDKVKEKAKAEHRDKLGERDDTIPPEYRHLLDDNDQGNAVKPPAKEPKDSEGGGDPIDALSKGFDNCSQTPSPEGPQKQAKKKDEKGVSTTKPAKNGGKSKTKEKSSKSKADGEKTS